MWDLGGFGSKLEYLLVAPPLSRCNSTCHVRKHSTSDHFQVHWGSITVIDAERRLVAQALRDRRNERFVLLSES
jgi:hypothetical protein